MKKLHMYTAILLCLIMLFNVVAIPANAEEEVLFSLGTVYDVQPGATVTLPVTLEGDYSARIITVEVNYDPANLTIAGPAKLRAGDLFPEDYADYGWATVKNVNNDTGVAKFGLMIAGDPSYPVEYQALTGSGTFFTIDFQVNDNCTTNQPVTLTVREFKYMPLGGTSGTPIPYIVTNGTVNIEGAANSTEEPTPEPTEVPTPVPTEITTPRPTSAPSETPSEQVSILIAGYYFEEEDCLDDWTMIDADGDTRNWISNLKANVNNQAYEGVGYILSESYINNYGAITPDNWAITPAITIYDISAVTLTFWAQAQDASYPQEHFGVAVGNTPNPSAMTMVNEWDMTASVTRASGAWYEYTVTLDGVTGIEPGTIYFAIRHFDCSDWFCLNVDCVTVTVEGDIEPSVNNATIILNVPEDVIGDGSGYQMLLDANADTFGSIIPEVGPLTNSGNAGEDVYDVFEYRIPENADGELSTSNIVSGASVAIEIPAGTYDWCITNPVPGDKVYIASSLGNVSGRFDNYVFRAGYTYEFIVTLNSDYGKDQVDVTIIRSSFLVTFMDWDGTVIKTQVVKDGGSAKAPEDPVREGCTFAGWNVDFSCVTEDLAVTAQYTPNPYLATYYLDGEQYSVQIVLFGSHIELLEVYREGYTFSGWMLADGSAVPETMPAHDLDIYGMLAPEYVTVTYVGSYTGTETLPYGADTVLPVLDVEGLHYTFTVNGEPWDGKNLTESVTVEVGMDINTYTVTFIDPITGDVISEQSITHGMNAVPPAAPEHYGYVFSGWDVAYTNVKSDLTVTAVYTPVEYSVVFMDGFGNVIVTQSVPYQHAAAAPSDPECEGWTFTGWNTDFSCVEHDMIINATWSRNHYTVTFVGVYTGTVTVEHGSDCELPVYDSPYLHYTFTVNGEPWDGKCITSDVTVTVSAAVNEVYTVTFVDWDGTVIMTQNVYYGSAASAPADPEREGYTFIGWDTEFTHVYSDLTVTALYEQNETPSEYLKGDVNCDGIVDSADITLAAAYAMSAGEVTPQGVANGDMNGDGLLTAADLSALYSFIQG